MVTDFAVVRARVAHASVRSDLHTPDETYMGCMAHFLNNAMKNSIVNCYSDSLLQVLAADFTAMKRIAEDSNKREWNRYVQDGYRLIQEVEKRFGTHYMVVERFLKSSSHVKGPLESRKCR